jgi:hypothetical protein
MGVDQTWDRVYKCVYKVPVVFGSPNFGFLKTLIERPFFRFLRN